MDKKIVGVIGAISGLAALDTAAQATPAATPTPDLMNARSFAELLDPIPNAVAALRAANAAAREMQGQEVGGRTGDTQVAGYHHHHHRYYHHHHHHHHHRVIIRPVLPYYHHHHHHHRYHHHHHSNW
jgi:hypothetical protein